MFKKDKKGKAKISYGWWFGKNIYWMTTLEMLWCGSVNNIISTWPKPHNYSKKRQKTFYFNERSNCAPQKETNDSDTDNNQKIYESMVLMFGNDKSSSRYFGVCLQFTNWTLDSGATCHVKPQILNLIPGLLEDKDKYTQVTGGHYATAKQKDKFK